jgi:hypothetical protein
VFAQAPSHRVKPGGHDVIGKVDDVVDVVEIDDDVYDEVVVVIDDVDEETTGGAGQDLSKNKYGLVGTGFVLFIAGTIYSRH